MAVRNLYNNIFIGGTDKGDMPENLPSGSIYIDEVRQEIFSYDVNEESYQVYPPVVTPVDSRPYKVFTANIWQDGTQAPQIQSVLENTLDYTPTFTRQSTGVYRVNLNPINGGKVGVFHSQFKGISGGGKFSLETPDNLPQNQPINYLQITTAFQDNAIDGLFNEHNPITIEIRIYN